MADEVQRRANALPERTIVHGTEWCTLVSVPAPDGSPYYMLEVPDYVCVVASVEQSLILVRQFRPVIGRETYELPSGHVDAGEQPETAARRELLEETGYHAESLELMGVLVPDVGRLANRMWCFHAPKVSRATDYVPESGITVELVAATLATAIAKVDHALNLAALFLAVAQGRWPGTAENQHGQP